MATFMRPWLDWLDWLKWDCIGAGIVGRILGLWFRVCVSVIRGLFRFVHRRLLDFAAYISKHSDFETPNRQLSAGSIPVIASGGLASIADIKALLEPRARKLEGAIAGRALYDGRLDAEEALNLIRNARTAA